MKPHQVDTFKLSTDPLFVDKVKDIVGLYMCPPDHAVVLCVDENTQVQALDRTQPIFPLLPGVPERRSHDYKRNGTIDLYAALNLATGEITHQLTAHHRAIEFKKFLSLIDKSVPNELDVKELADSITHWVGAWNEDPRPYVWHKTADEILASLSGYLERIVDSGH